MDHLRPRLIQMLRTAAGDGASDVRARAIADNSGAVEGAAAEICRGVEDRGVRLASATVS